MDATIRNTIQLNRNFLLFESFQLDKQIIVSIYYNIRNLTFSELCGLGQRSTFYLDIHIDEAVFCYKVFTPVLDTMCFENQCIKINTII